MGMRDKSELEINIHTLLYIRQITNMSFCMAQGTLLNILDNPYEKRARKSMDLCVLELLCCAPETNYM